jgi:hypothetical protein
MQILVDFLKNGSTMQILVDFLKNGFTINF